MATILNIETATSVCSVAVSKNGELIALKESDEDNVHAEKLMVFIEECLAQCNLSMKNLDAVALGSGPGSYTGLRIGTSTAKGLCYGLSIPLIAISTLKAMALSVLNAEFRRQNSEDRSWNPELICPMIDARRMEVYTALYDSSGKEILPVEAKVLDENSFSEYLNKYKIIFCGNGMLKLKNLLSSNKNAIWIDTVKASASNLISLSAEAYGKSDFADLAYYEPFYLKEFVAKKSAKN